MADWLTCMLLFATVREAAGVQLLSSADSSSDTPNVVSFAVRRRREGADDSLQISTLSFGFFSFSRLRIISIAALATSNCFIVWARSAYRRHSPISLPLIFSSNLAAQKESSSQNRKWRTWTLRKGKAKTERETDRTQESLQRVRE